MKLYELQNTAIAIKKSSCIMKLMKTVKDIIDIVRIDSKLNSGDSIT